jgi:hypothetical protein
VTRKYFVLALSAAVVLPMALWGCGGGDNGPAPGRVRVIQAVPELSSQNIDVMLNGQFAANNVAYNGLSASSGDVPSGTVTARVLQAGTSTQVLSDSTITVTPSIDQLVIVTGRPGVTSGDQRLQIANLGRIDLSTSNIPQTGFARFYFLNAVPQAPVGGVNFSYQVGTGAVQSPAGIQNITAPLMTAAQFFDVVPGAVTVTATVGDETVTAAPFTAKGQGTYLALLTGNPASTGLTPGLSLKVFTLNEP